LLQIKGNLFIYNDLQKYIKISGRFSPSNKTHMSQLWEFI